MLHLLAKYFLNAICNILSEITTKVVSDQTCILSPRWHSKLVTEHRPHLINPHINIWFSQIIICNLQRENLYDPSAPRVMASLFQIQNSRSSNCGSKRRKLKTIPESRGQHGMLFRPNSDSLSEIVSDGALKPRTVAWLASVWFAPKNWPAWRTLKIRWSFGH